jgi:hypothetical protein
VKDKTDGVEALNVARWMKDESEQALQSDIRNAQEQFD